MAVLRVALPVLASALVLLGCGGERRAGPAATVTLTYWPSTNPNEVELAEQLIAEWNAAHPDTQVRVQPLPEGRSGEEVLIIAAAGGTAPDICSNVGPVIVPLLARAGALLPVDQFEGGRDYLENRLPEGMVKQFVDANDSLYQIPWKTNPILVQYNLAHLREAGFAEPPRSWAQWNDLAERISGDRDGDGRADRWMADINIVAEWRQRLFDFYAFYIAASGGRTLLEDNRYVSFDNDTARAVFDFFAEGFERGWYANSIWAGDVFLQGRMAAHITGPWNIAHTERFKPPGFEYTFGPIPVPEGTQGEVPTFGDPKSIGIFSTTEHPDAAWDVVRFLTGRHADLGLLEGCNQLPLRRELLADTLFTAFFEANPMMRQFAEKVPHTRGFDQNPALQEVFDALGSAFEAACVIRAVEPEKALAKAAQRARHVLKARGI